MAESKEQPKKEKAPAPPIESKDTARPLEFGEHIKDVTIHVDLIKHDKSSD